MLVLARRAGQTIRIGDELEVVVVNVRGDQVRLGIRAPRHIPVLRGELHQQVSDENRAAARAALLLPPGEASEGVGQAPKRLKPRLQAADKIE
jgi:carbon storage regulator